MSNRGYACRTVLGTVGVVIVVVVCSLLLVSALTDIPGRVLARDPDWVGLSPLERLQMEAALRTSMIQALGGLVLAVGSAIAISQYALSRAQREDARAVQKSMAYAAALAELSADSETRRLGAVILLKTGVETRSYDKAEVAAVLAQYIRDYAGIPGAGSSIDLAIQTIDAAKPGDSPVNLRGLDLRGRNFRSVNLQHFDLVHADLRGALLPMTDKAEGIPAD